MPIPCAFRGLLHTHDDLLRRLTQSHSSKIPRKNKSSASPALPNRSLQLQKRHQTRQRRPLNSPRLEEHGAPGGLPALDTDLFDMSHVPLDKLQMRGRARLARCHLASLRRRLPAPCVLGLGDGGRMAGASKSATSKVFKGHSPCKEPLGPRGVPTPGGFSCQSIFGPGDVQREGCLEARAEMAAQGSDMDEEWSRALRGGRLSRSRAGRRGRFDTLSMGSKRSAPLAPHSVLNRSKNALNSE